MLLIALAFAAACRVPVTLGPVNYDSDMIRYIWDGRVQRFGYSPYSVIPADPALAHTHTADTARMPSRNVGTPYLPAAQLFFRAMVTLWESPLAMRLALLALDLLTIVVLLRWLRITGRSEWLVLAYAWNPLVILESAHSSHIDVLGTFWITASAYWLAGRRTALASCAFTLAVATKLLPIVLAPLFIGRIRHRDIALGIGLLVALYLPFMSGAALPVGAVPNVVEHIRFNSPIFRPLAWVITPNGAAVFALLVGFGAAVWARVKLDANNPAAWAWPMALALLCAPVIYPWYLLLLHAIPVHARHAPADRLDVHRHSRLHRLGTGPLGGTVACSHRAHGPGIRTRRPRRRDRERRGALSVRAGHADAGREASDLKPRRKNPTKGRDRFL